MDLKQLSDIPAAPPDFLAKLAGLAKEPAGPQSTQQRSSGTAGRGDRPGRPAGPTSPAGRPGSQLGPLDVGRYLEAHGIPYTTKTDAKGTFYLLDECLFDPEHVREASIVQYADGRLFYQCFHNSCKRYGWSDARSHISGDESLARFCDGYDPNWQPPPPSSKPPGEKKRRPYIEWKESRDGSKRPVVYTARLADLLEEKLAPIYYEGKDFGDAFYRYSQDGVWKFYPQAAIKKHIRTMLGDVCKAHHLRETEDLLKAQCYRAPEKVQADPMLLNLKNGMLALATRSEDGSFALRPHAPEYYSRVQLPVNYNKEAERTDWENAVIQNFKDDVEKADVLQQFFGYCLYPKIIFPCALFQIGGGGNGKGVVEYALNQMLGKDNVSHISLARMEKDFGPVEIKDKLLNSCGETESKPLDVTNFKKIVAGDEIQAEVKYKGDVKFTPIAKHMISMNSFPGLKEKTNSFFRRVIVLEYKQEYGKEEGQIAPDPAIYEKIDAQIDGIFMWSLEGLEFVLDHGEISLPDAVETAKIRFRQKVNPILTFAEECLELGDEHTSEKPALYNEYKKWCEDSGLKGMGKSNFYEQVQLNLGAVQYRPKDSTKMLFKGLRILVNWER